MSTFQERSMAGNKRVGLGPPPEFSPPPAASFAPPPFKLGTRVYTNAVTHSQMQKNERLEEYRKATVAAANALQPSN
jgi:hypothetical protein